MRRFRTRAPWLASCLLACGCSTGRYDADYAEAVARYREAAPFAVLQPGETDFATGRVALRLPEGFLAVPEGQPADEGAAPAASPTRLRPPFLEALPGYQGTAERRMAAGPAELPATVAIWTVPAAEGSRAAVEKSLLEKARGDEAFKGQAAAWQDRQVRPAAGGPAAWRVLSLNGSQLFEGVVAGNPEVKRHQGPCELWLSADPVDDLRTLLVWRVPDEVTGLLPVPPPVLAETLARTVVIRPASVGGDEAAAEPGAAAPAE